MTAIGPYWFTETDVERTLANGRTLFDLLPGGFPPDPASPAAPHRLAAEAALDELADTDPVRALEVVWEEWRNAIAQLRAAGTFGHRAEGAVAGLFLGDGGVPKRSVEQVEVSWSGVRGDRQDDRRNHGRPWQALCLWSGEVVDDLAGDGHPIHPGAAGENLSLRGLPWDRVVPGTHLALGDVRVEVSSYALPCKTNAGWFSDGSFDRIHHRHGPVSRVYATVLSPGTITVGDVAVLEPAA
ncbi:MAG: MOSC domain-containing protein [Acidimicrobiales bacterium]|nr:MOSC domain-containing protein [Acidimicrobiales bacterium]